MTSAAIIPIVPEIQLKRVLYATDFSEGSTLALPVADAIARRYGSEIVAVHVLPPLLYPMVRPEVVSMMEEKRKQEAMKRLADLPGVTGAPGISIRPMAEIGDPVEEVERVVREQGIDLAVLCTHGPMGMRRVAMGSTAEALFRSLSCPVLTVGPHLAGRFRGKVEIDSILFPTDLSEESRAVFPYLASLGHQYKAKIILLHVLPPETGSNPDARLLAEPLRKEMRRTFGPKISPDCEAEFVIEFGNAAERILEEAQARGVDLIGFGIRPTAKMATHFPNTVTGRVLGSASCPVLTCHQHAGW